MLSLFDTFAMRLRAATPLTLVAPLLLATSAQAQTPPDAGSLLRQQQATPPTPPRVDSSGAPVLKAPSAPLQAAERASGASIRVEHFVFAGTPTVFSQAQLQATVAGWLGRSLSLSELQDAAAAITRLYRANGYFLALARLPQQDVSDHSVTIVISEGRLDSKEGVRVRGDGLRLKMDRVLDTLHTAAPSDQPLRLDQLERGLLLLSDLPGIRPAANLELGGETGTTRVVLDMKEDPVLTSQAMLDNYGNRFTGNQRLSAGFNLNDPSGRGEQYSLMVTKAIDGEFNYARFGYSQPLWNNSLRAGISYSALAYAVGEVTPDPHIKGSAANWTVNLRYALLRSRERNLYLSGAWDQRALYSEAADIRISNKQVVSQTLGLQFDQNDALGGGGTSYASLGVTDGRLDLSADPGNLAQDQATGLNTQGSYNKLNWSLSRSQRLGDSVSLSANFSGQVTSNNLDGAEKFQLGGPGGVRAYPASEAAGDEGQRATLEANWALANHPILGFFSAQAFYDWGSVRQFSHPGTLAMATPNSYQLSGWGLGLSLTKPNRWDARLQWAQKIGSNPAPSAQGKDADGLDDSGRVWLSVSAYF